MKWPRTYDMGSTATCRKQRQDARAAADVHHGGAAQQLRVALQSLSVGLRARLQWQLPYRKRLT